MNRDAALKKQNLQNKNDYKDWFLFLFFPTIYKA